MKYHKKKKKKSSQKKNNLSAYNNAIHKSKKKWKPNENISKKEKRRKKNSWKHTINSLYGVSSISHSQAHSWWGKVHVPSSNYYSIENNVFQIIKKLSMSSKASKKIKITLEFFSINKNTP
jgi:hypothetical protein